MISPTRKHVSSGKNKFVTFHRKTGVFELRPGNMLYAFCINAGGHLEHLYWGQNIVENASLSYLQSSNVKLAFQTEAPPIDVKHKQKEFVQQLIEREKRKDIRPQQVWKNFRGSNDVYRKRTENISWRMWTRNRTKGISEGGKLVDDMVTALPRVDFKKQNVMAKRALSKEYGATESEKRRSENPLIKDGTDSKNIDITAINNGNISKSNNSTKHDSSENGTGRSPGGKRGGRQSPTLTFSKNFSVSNLQDLWEGEDPGQNQHINSFLISEVYRRKKSIVGKGAIKHEYSDFGTGDFRSPSFRLSYTSDGSHISPILYKSHRIIPGKVEMKDKCMPHIRSWAKTPAEEKKFATTLIITMSDKHTGFEIDLIYTVIHNHDVIVRSTVFRNPLSVNGRQGNNYGKGNNPIRYSARLHRVMSATVDFENERGGYYCTYLSGSWARERIVEETKLQPGTFSIGSTRGTSSHVHNPFFAISRGGPSNENNGDIFGFALVYSGNHVMEAERNEVGRIRINAGINPMCFSWALNPGDEFQTPECVMVYSSTGIGGMSRTFHTLFLDHLLPKEWSHMHPPILLNSWEAKYFDVSHDNIIQMATQASNLGIEMIVLDDGWFGERNDANTSLGDWEANRKKFPYGIRGCAQAVNSVGLKMGLWFEPEMISVNSKLYQQHPDWCLHVPGRPMQRGRNQLVLNMGRTDVRDYLYKCISKIIEKANIAYIKWDMNRYLTEVFSVELENSRQGETSHRFMLGTYDLLNRIVNQFPHVLLETCSGGGGRFDPGMLYFSPQIWTSDNTDALNRVDIQYGTSLLYPARAMGSHYSMSPNHITMRQCRSRTRAFVAMCGTFGFELNLGTISVEERGYVSKFIDMYKEVRDVVAFGNLYRLWDPKEDFCAAWMYVSYDRQNAAVFVFNTGMRHWSDLMPTLRLQGLAKNTLYEITEPMPNEFTRKEDNLQVVRATEPSYQLSSKVVYLRGSTLMLAGIPVKFFAADDAVCFKLTAKQSSHEADADNAMSPSNSYLNLQLLEPRSEESQQNQALFF